MFSHTTMKTNVTTYRKRKPCGRKIRIKRGWRKPSPFPNPFDPGFAPYVPAKAKTATVTIRCGRESLSFRVRRWDATRMICRGRVQQAARLGKVVAVALEGIL